MVIRLHYLSDHCPWTEQQTMHVEHMHAHTHTNTHTHTHQVFSHDICGVMFERPPGADARNSSASKKPPPRSIISSSWESNAVNRALSLTGGLKASEPEVSTLEAPKSSLVTRYLLKK